MVAAAAVQQVWQSDGFRYVTAHTRARSRQKKDVHTAII